MVEIRLGEEETLLPLPLRKLNRISTGARVNEHAKARSISGASRWGRGQVRRITGDGTMTFRTGRRHIGVRGRFRYPGDNSVLALEEAVDMSL